jgi:K+/H+ antiporter YhaU regulatory subunit KhtT
MGANAIFNVLERGEVLTVSEGLDLFKATVPSELVGRTLGTSQLREETGCNVVALLEEGRVQVDPGPEETLNEGAALVLIAPGESEQRFLERYGD